MKKTVLIIGVMLISSLVIAQDQNTQFKKEAASAITKEFPKSRVFNIEYGQSLSRDFESKLYDEAFQDGEITSQQTIAISANVPFKRYKKWTFSASGNYTFNEFKFKHLENISATRPFNQNSISNFHNFSLALNSTLFSSLFKKPLIYNGSIIVDGNEKGLERLKGLLGASIILKRTERTTITTGLIIIIDPTAQIPFAPTFSLNHKFKNSAWELDFILPQRILFKRPVFNHGRLSIGSTFGSSGFYINANQPNFPNVSEYSQLEIKSGVIYEHKLNNKLILTAKGGVVNFISNRLTEKGEPSQDFIYENDQDMSGYFNIGFSFNPF